MALLRESTVYRAAARAKSRRRSASAERILKEQASPEERRYDIFLSHALRDAELVVGAKQVLEELGHSVYVDWIEDRQLDRARVNAETAQILRARMTCCGSLLYLHTPNAPHSKWMPWELGFFDGHNGSVAILPVVPDNASDTFRGQEYLGLYPYVDITQAPAGASKSAWVNRPGGGYARFESWMRGAPQWR